MRLVSCRRVFETRLSCVSNIVGHQSYWTKFVKSLDTTLLKNISSLLKIHFKSKEANPTKWNIVTNPVDVQPGCHISGVCMFCRSHSYVAIRRMFSIFVKPTVHPVTWHDCSLVNPRFIHRNIYTYIWK